jgi:hypothetical protein
MVGRFNILGPWIIDAQKDPLSTPNYIGFVLFVAGRRGHGVRGTTRAHRVVALCVLVAATLLGLFSTMRIFGVFFEYVIRWMLPLVVPVVATCVWSCWLTWRARSQDVSESESRATSESRPIQCDGVLVVCAAVLTGIGVARAATAEVPYQRDSAITGALASQLEASLDPAKRYQINEVDPVAWDRSRSDWRWSWRSSSVHAGVGPWGRVSLRSVSSTRIRPIQLCGTSPASR